MDQQKQRQQQRPQQRRPRGQGTAGTQQAASPQISCTLILLAGALLIGAASGEHEQASAAPAAPLDSLMEAAGAPDDLIAAESSPALAASDGPEHKAFTGAQVLRQAEQAAASVAPAVFGGHQQAPAGVYQPTGHLAGRFPGQQLHQQQQAAPKHLNPFMAAALAGSYGPAQQQMAAAALHAQQQAHQQQHQQHQQHQQMHHPAHHPQQMLHQQQHQMVGPAPQPQQLAPGLRQSALPAPQNSVNGSPVDSNELGAEQAGQQQVVAQASAQHAVIAPAASTSSPQATSVALAGGQQEAWPLQAPDIPKIVNLEVKCEKNLMKVSVEFDKIFNGVIFSKGHYSQGQCVHVGPNSNKQQAYFDISINSCGTQGNTQNGLYGMGQNTGSGTFFENTIVIQYDPNVQEVYDHARKLRCTWHDQYEKAVTFRPFPVDMLDIVRADFAGDNVGCWMQIQVGKGPWASEVAGIVKIGQTMTMVLAIKDEENKFDMLVRNCFAHDGKRGPIELVDKSGCITRPKLMSRFTKIKNFGSSATVLSYAHFQAFKFPDSMEVHFQCTIQICRHQCPEQCAAGPSAIGASSGHPSEAYSESTISGTFNIHSGGQSSNGDPAGGHLRKFGAPALSRERRSANWSNGSHHHHHHHQHQQKPLTQSVGLNRIIQVVSTGDLAFAIKEREAQQLTSSEQSALSAQLELATSQVCMSSFNFVLSLVMLALILLCSCLAAISLYIRQRSLLAAAGHKTRPSSAASSPGSTMSDKQLLQSGNNYQQFVQTNVPTTQKQQQLFYPDRR